MTSEPLRILIVANKTWECEPLVSVLLSKDGPPTGFGSLTRGYEGAESTTVLDPATGLPPELPPEAEGLALRGKLPVRPRLKFSVSRPTDKEVLAHVEVWCIEDWMRTKRHTLTGTSEASGSSSHEKFTVALPLIRANAFKGAAPGLVVAFGTAGIPSEQTFNGCVAIGSRIYVNDPWDDASKEEKEQQTKRFGPLLQDLLAGWLGKRLDCPRLSGALFAAAISAESRYAAEARFLDAPINPARPPRILAGHGYASLGTINICDYDDYVWADEDTHARFAKQIKQREIGSAETTHGLIRLVWHDAPFLFVSGLTDRVPYFNAEVTPRKYAQNFAAAHNAGLALAHMLPELARLSKEPGKLFDEDARTIDCEEGPLPPPSWPSAPPVVECPQYTAGEEALDCPWAGLARRMTKPGSSAKQVLEEAKDIVEAIRRERELLGCFDSWGQCLNVDELALAPIVDPAILSAIAELAGVEVSGPAWHAGLTHTYGYLFSLLRTAFGYKRKRWVDPALDVGFGLPLRTLGPRPLTGTFLGNVTWFFGHIAFAGEPAPLARLARFKDGVATSLREFSYNALRRHRRVEAVELAGGGGARVVCRTDLVELPRPGADTHLLVYSIDDSRVDGPRLISGFPVGAAMARTLLSESASGEGREVRSRYNAYVPGLTQLGVWGLSQA